MAAYRVTGAQLTAVADAIRAKGGTNASLTFPSGFVSAIGNISTGGTGLATEPYVEYTLNQDGQITAAKMVGFTSIPARLFYQQTALTTVDFSESPNITSIGNYAFYGCTNLALTALPSGVVSIGAYAFHNCTSLALTALPAGVTSIGAYAFYCCTQMALTALPAGITEIPQYAFYNTAIELTALPSGITSIEQYAFYGCTHLALTALPSGLSVINTYSFQSCTSLALTALPAGITLINANAFYNCTSLALTALPSGLTNIGANAFYNTPITLTSLPSTVTSIGNSAFWKCNSIVNIEIGSTKLGTGTKIFQNCSALEKVWIRSTCTTITAASAANAPFVGCPAGLAVYAEPSAKPAGWGNYFNRTGSSGATTVTVTYDQATKPW